jgi:hypothetical protein
VKQLPSQQLPNKVRPDTAAVLLGITFLITAWLVACFFTYLGGLI